MTTAATTHTITDRHPGRPTDQPQRRLPSTTATLGFARADLRHATDQHDPQRRRHYAVAARDNAVTVLLADDATDTERRDAEHYLVEAETLIANT